MNDLARTLKRLLSLGLCSAIVALSAGTDAYAAIGRAVEVSGAAHGPSAAAPVAPVSLRLPAIGAPQALPGAALGVSSIKQVPSAAVSETAAIPSLAPAAALGATASVHATASIDARPAGATAKVSASAAAAASVPAQAGAQAASGAASLDSAAASLEQAAPSSVAKTSRIASTIRSIKSIFGAKAAQDVAAGAVAPAAGTAAGVEAPAPAIDPAARLQASAANAPSGTEASAEPAQDHGQPPAPPSGDDNSGGGKDGGGASLRTAWRNATLFIVAMLVAQVGIEAWAASSGKWVQTIFGKDGYATMTMVGMGVSLASGYASGWLADKLGIKKTAVISTILYAGAGAAMLLAFKAGVLTFPVLLGIAAARTFLGSASSTAEQIIPIAIFKDHRSSLEKFNSTSQFILEVAGIGVPFMIGSLLLAFGSVGTMWILPVTVGLSGAMLLLVGMGEVQKQKKTAAAAPSGEREGDATLLKLGLRVYPAITVLNSLLYTIIALSYGNYVHPGASPAELALAAGAAGKVVSLYSAGGLIAAAILSGIPGMIWTWLGSKLPRLAAAQARLAARFPKKDSGLSDEQKDIKRISKWLVVGAVSLVCFVPMLWTNALLATVAMIPFGIANVMSSLQVMSMVQRNVPQEKKGKTMGALRTVNTLLAGLGMFAFSALFKHYPASPMPFMVLLGLLGAIGAYYFVFARKLSAYAATKKK